LVPHIPFVIRLQPVLLKLDTHNVFHAAELAFAYLIQITLRRLMEITARRFGGRL
jgi:hypothetical protein